MKFVTIKESHYQNDLIVLKSRLESEGIECHLKNELTTQILNHIPSFLVELQVPEDKVDHARNIMIETGETDTPATLVKCPECHSQNVGLKMDFGTRIKLFFMFISSALTFTAPNPQKLLNKSQFECRECGHKFKTV
ncbi:MAG: putative signal transducing protein [Bacteroidota bacterium]